MEIRAQAAGWWPRFGPSPGVHAGMSSRKRTIGEDRISPSQGGSLARSDPPCVRGDQSTHALAEPDDFRIRMPFLDELGEGEQIAIPIPRIADIAAALA